MLVLKTQQNWLFPQSSYSKYCNWTFFIKNYWIFVSRLFSNCSKSRNALKTSRSYISVFFSNFVFVKFFSYLKNCFYNSVLILLQKKEKSPHFFVKRFYKTIYNLRISMFYQNREQSFILYYLVFARVRFHVTVIRITQMEGL